MSMQIHHKRNPAFFLKLHYITPCSISLRCQFLLYKPKYLQWIFLPSSIQVQTRKVASRVSMDHTIRIDHRNYHNLKSPQKKVRLFSVFITFFIVRKGFASLVINFGTLLVKLFTWHFKEIHDSFSHKTTHTFRWMLSSHKKNDLSLENFLFFSQTHRDHRNDVIGKCVSKTFDMNIEILMNSTFLFLFFQV